MDTENEDGLTKLILDVTNLARKSTLWKGGGWHVVAALSQVLLTRALASASFRAQFAQDFKAPIDEPIVDNKDLRKLVCGAYLLAKNTLNGSMAPIVEAAVAATLLTEALDDDNTEVRDACLAAVPGPTAS